MSIRPTRDAAPDAVGILLAAGAGRRMGTPKALVIDDDGEPWLARGVRVLREGGCERVVVVLGAAPEAESLIPADLRARVTVTIADEWARGQSASLRAGIRAVQAEPGFAALVSLVDLPGLRAPAVRRVLAAARGSAQPSPASALLQAAYDGRPGHPVFLGAAHLAPLLKHLHGDTGARPYLLAHDVRIVDCTDLGGGDDVDTPG
ncbi:nucleotidyltransferase family protein [Herbiconiux sp.]|uniref:nucleotidyltransferase family protein n=1 Tax=Herbiconiux sp. TaxID=1871186 RepID=UPI0025BF744F|nr:nucleotidyltransferase family protein [Herbiconiux sp.]